MKNLLLKNWISVFILPVLLMHTEPSAMLTPELITHSFEQDVALAKPGGDTKDAEEKAARVTLEIFKRMAGVIQQDISGNLLFWYSRPAERVAGVELPDRDYRVVDCLVKNKEFRDYVAKHIANKTKICFGTLHDADNPQFLTSGEIVAPRVGLFITREYPLVTACCKLYIDGPKKGTVEIEIITNPHSH